MSIRSPGANKTQYKGLSECLRIGELSTAIGKGAAP